jgi:hypothetical protein
LRSWQGRGPRAGEVALPEDTGQRVRQWAESEGKKTRAGKDLAKELGDAMRAHGHDPTPIREAMGG